MKYDCKYGLKQHLIFFFLAFPKTKKFLYSLMRNVPCLKTGCTELLYENQ